MSPRSILKQNHRDSVNYNTYASSSTSHPTFSALPFASDASPHVHFPPTPSLSQTYLTHSEKIYDRAPIVVSPNTCALPERGCPGRTYHPSTFATSEDRRSHGSPPSRRSPTSTSSLLPDPRRVRTPELSFSSSSSDESDGLTSPPNGYVYGPTGAGQQRRKPSMPIPSHTPEELNQALLFLPHPHGAPMPPKDGERKKKCAVSTEPGKSSRNRSHSPNSRGDYRKYTSRTDVGSRGFAPSVDMDDGCLGGF